MFWIFIQVFLSNVAISSFKTIYDGFLPPASLSISSAGDIGTGTLTTSVYTEQEQQALVKFRQLIENSLDKDYERADRFLIPWIRESNFNLIQARDMLLKAKEWRRVNRMDTILNETLLTDVNDLRLTSNACVLDGVDNDGSPVVILNSGGIEIRKWELKGKGHLLKRFMIKCLEQTVVKIRRLAQSTGKEISQSVCILDFKGFSLKQHTCTECVKRYLEFFRIVENYYPQLAKHMVAINVPKFAHPFIELAKKGAMSASSGKALKIFGQDKKVWTAYLLKIIPPDQLPVYLGGTRVVKQSGQEFRSSDD